MSPAKLEEFFLVIQKVKINKSLPKFIAQEWLDNGIEKLRIVPVDIEVELMTDLLIVNFKFLLRTVTSPRSDPLEKSQTQQFCILDHVGKTDSCPSAASADLYCFSFLYFVDLTRHRPASLLAVILDNAMS